MGAGCRVGAEACRGRGTYRDGGQGPDRVPGVDEAEGLIPLQALLHHAPVPGLEYFQDEGAAREEHRLQSK